MPSNLKLVDHVKPRSRHISLSGIKISPKGTATVFSRFGVSPDTSLNSDMTFNTFRIFFSPTLGLFLSAFKYNVKSSARKKKVTN